jgi:hypothetical protein
LWFHATIAVRSRAGFPDLTLVHPTRNALAMWELKRQVKYRISAKQREWIGALTGSEGHQHWLPSSAGLAMDQDIPDSNRALGGTPDGRVVEYHGWSAPISSEERTLYQLGGLLPTDQLMSPPRLDRVVKYLRDENETLRQITKDLHWAARRYADGRRTYITRMFNENTRTLLKLGVKLNPTGDGTVWARDGMGRSFDGLSDEEAGQGVGPDDWRTPIDEERRMRVTEAAERLETADRRFEDARELPWEQWVGACDAWQEALQALYAEVRTPATEE